jgi:hypothetical protein
VAIMRVELTGAEAPAFGDYLVVVRIHEVA